MRLKYKVVLNGASTPKNFLLLVLDPAEGSKTLNSICDSCCCHHDLTVLQVGFFLRPVIIEGCSKSV